APAQGATSAVPAPTQFAFSLAGLPISSWGFAVRLWIAVTISLLTSFWLQLEAPFSAALTVLILAEPTRGQALAKAGWRLIATIIGVAASIAITRQSLCGPFHRDETPVPRCRRRTSC